MKKIPTLYQRDFSHDHGRFVGDAVNPEAAWVFTSSTVVATRKWDGTCVRIDSHGGPWARREVKPGKTPPAGFVEIGHDDTTGKTVGWEPAEQSAFAALIAEAVAAQPPLRTGTYELIGPKVNGNPERAAAHGLVQHGVERIRLRGLTRDAIVECLRAHPDIEGIVFWERHLDSDARMAKIKRRDLPEFAASEPKVAEHVTGPHPCREEPGDERAR